MTRGFYRGTEIGHRGARSDDFVTVSGTIKQRTEAAVLIDIGKTAEMGAWLPKSQLDAESRDEVESADLNERIDLRVRRWIAEEKGLI